MSISPSWYAVCWLLWVTLATQLTIVPAFPVLNDAPQTLQPLHVPGAYPEEGSQLYNPESLPNPNDLPTTNGTPQPSVDATGANLPGLAQYFPMVGQLSQLVSGGAVGGSNAASTLTETPDTTITPPAGPLTDTEPAWTSGSTDSLRTPGNPSIEAKVASVTLDHLRPGHRGHDEDFEIFSVQTKLAPVLAAESTFPQPPSRWSRYYQTVQNKSYLPNWLKSTLLYPVPNQHRY
ncbi:hypothetical protein H4R34_004822 [Dimargaris verticillata]|uniref:Uncharacterized protein n=1 Tax=Dimargaris verticillata TaxID=2761393 RepID=A0A9W8AY33_9FUNG|nr:hypothetical protein H4R34_004822 [Dimargaris verticillata]